MHILHICTIITHKRQQQKARKYFNFSTTVHGFQQKCVIKTDNDVTERVCCQSKKCENNNFLGGNGGD